MGRSRDRSRSGSLSSTSSGRTARARNWEGEGGYRLHLSDLAMGVSRHDIEKIFRAYGPLNEVWVASNPPCFAFINFRHRADGEQALKELDGKIIGGSRIGLSWARARNYGGRPIQALLYRSPSPSSRRGYRDSYSSRRGNDRYGDRRRYVAPRRRYSRSRSRSPGYRRSNGNDYSRRRPRSPSPRSPSPRNHRREKRQKTSQRPAEERRPRSPSSQSNSDRDESGSLRNNNGNRSSRSASGERRQVKSSNGGTEDRRVEIEVHETHY